MIGGLLVLVEIGNIFGRAQPLTGNRDQIEAMKAMEVILLVLGAWLIYSGAAASRKKTN